ncbi:MAG: efflux RND transporter periplasmic adaptor subunit [Bacteroidota bacterium]|nr:efflux RND transporter periplasmic adaptor subunit [Bacteroidota bacterium]
MKKQIIKFSTLVIVTLLIAACGNNAGEDSHNHQEGEQHESDEGQHEEHGDVGGMREVHLSNLKFQSLDMKVDTLPTRPLSGVVYANGQLEVPPQHEATVTAILGGNITSIKVIEGDKVSKGQVLAYLNHPDLAKVQTEYLRTYNRSNYLEQEFQRQKKLYQEEVGSGKTFQETKSEYQSVKGEVKGYESQLKQLNLNVNKIRNGEIYENIPVVSPIDGYIEKVMIQLGQYIQPQTAMFKVVNTDHIHADLMVFEKDVHKVKQGQKISFTVESVPGSQLTAEIYSVGKQFEQNPKAVHIHAEIDQKKDYLIPGMYINGKIHTSNDAVTALPEGAVIEEEGEAYIFIAEQHNEDGETEWAFKPVEIRTGNSDEGWVEINLLEPLTKGTKVAWNNAYYLISEMKKSQTSHSH